MATLDLVTVSEAAAYLQQPSNSSLIDELITAVSLMIDDRCGPVVERSMGTKPCDGGETTIWLDPTPIYAVSTVVEYIPGSTSGTTLTASTNTSIAANGYIIDTTKGSLTRVASGRPIPFVAGLKNVEVTFHAGRYATTAAVSQQFKQAALISVSHNWQLEHGTRNSTFGAIEDGGSTFGYGWALPKRALEILGTQVRPTVGIA